MNFLSKANTLFSRKMWVTHFVIARILKILRFAQDRLRNLWVSDELVGD
jgi:hypothetical protein